MANRSAVIIGASYAGLVAAAALRCNDWHVQVIEKSIDRLRTGGGVVVQKQMAEYLAAQGITFPEVPSVPAKTRQIFKDDGTVLRMPENAAVYTAWDVLLRAVENHIGSDVVRRGVSMTDLSGIDQNGWVELDSGERLEADLVIAADGIGSRARHILLPDLEPEWAGYIAWRGMVNENEISAKTRALLGDSLNLSSGGGTTIVIYEVPGDDGSVSPGHRRFNFVWYEAVESERALSHILTDRTGGTHRASVGRGYLADDVDRSARDTAERVLHPAFAEIVQKTPELYVQSIEDLVSPRLVFGRTVLIGDAASLVRPHIGSGTAKAVDDAITLAHALTEPREDGSCLAAWEQARLDDHYGLAEYGRAVARRFGLGTTSPEIATSSTAALR